MSARLVLEVGNVSVYDLLGSGDDEKLEKMLGLYERLFPRYSHYVPRMRRRARFGNGHRPDHILHYWLIEVDGQPAGLRTFRYVRHRRCGLAHALAIDPQFRRVEAGGRRLSVFVIHECLAQVVRDAKESGDPPPYGMVNEVEPERLMEHYIRNGLVQLPLKYMEPIFPPEVEGRNRSEELALTAFAPMHIGFLPNPEVQVETFTRDMISDFALAFLVDHYGLPEDHPVVLQVLETIYDQEKHP
jgi:hypothetical protein